MGLLDRYGYRGYPVSPFPDDPSMNPAFAPRQFQPRRPAPSAAPQVKPLPAPMPVQPPQPIAPALDMGTGLPMDAPGVIPQQARGPDRQPQPGDAAEAEKDQKKKGGLLSRIGDSFSNREDGWNSTDWLQMGLSLMGHAQNGGDWGGVAQDFGQITQGITGRKDRSLSLEDREREIKRQEEADARQKEEFEAWRAGQKATAGIQGRLDEERAKVDQAYAAAATPEEKAALESKRLVLSMLTPEQFGNYLAQEREMEIRAKQEADQRAAMVAENEKDREARAAEAALQRKTQLEIASQKDPRERIGYQLDVRRVGEMSDAALYAKNSILPKLTRAEEILTQLGTMQGVNQPLSANQRIFLSRVTMSNPEAKGLLDELKSIQTELGVEDAKKLAPVSNTDFTRLIEIKPNADMELGGALRVAARMRQDVQRGVQLASDASRWMDDHQGLTGTLDTNRKTFEEVFSAANPPVAQEKSWPQPPKNALAVLRSNPSEEAQAEFDELFGPGSAAAYLATTGRRTTAMGSGKSGLRNDNWGGSRR